MDGPRSTLPCTATRSSTTHSSPVPHQLAQCQRARRTETFPTTTAYLVRSTAPPPSDLRPIRCGVEFSARFRARPARVRSEPRLRSTRASPTRPCPYCSPCRQSRYSRDHRRRSIRLQTLVCWMLRRRVRGVSVRRRVKKTFRRKVRSRRCSIWVRVKIHRSVRIHSE